MDVFSYDLLLVPVHLGMHWCLAVVDFSVPGKGEFIASKSLDNPITISSTGVYYYDSMGGNNRACLEALCDYLRKEHEDKKKEEYSTDGFQVGIFAKCYYDIFCQYAIFYPSPQMVVMKDIPQQNNSSDCGMFSCKFAEYLSRRADITFDQGRAPRS